MLEGPRTCRMPHPQKTVRYGIDLLGVKFKELAVLVNENHPLVRLFCERIVADGIMCEIIEDFQSQKVARCADIDVPVEDRVIDDLYMFCMAASGGGGRKLGSLAGGESGGDFDDFVLSAFIDLWMDIANVIENVEHQGSVSRAKFVDDEIVEGMMGEHVVCD